MVYLTLIAGLVVLYWGAEWLVKGASRLALTMGISPLAIGLTIVAMGTSTPELIVSIKAAFSGQADLSVGNIVGSNIFNVLFILGICGLISPLIVTKKLVQIDVPIMIGVSFLLLLFSMDGKIKSWEGFTFLGGLIGYTIFSFKLSKNDSNNIEIEALKDFSKKEKTKLQIFIINILFIIGGLILLVIGAQWLIDSSIAIARQFGLSEAVIGLTLVAAGTSLPEVATSIVATIKGQRDIAIGNVVGSNIFNILGILGVASLFPEGGLNISEAMIEFDIPVMTAVAIACFPIFFTGHLIARWEGAVFFGYYIFYTTYLFLDSQHHPHLQLFKDVMMFFVLPLTTLTVTTFFVRHIHRNKEAKNSAS